MDQWQNDSPLPSSSTTLACQYTGLHLHHIPHKLWAWRAISTAEIWDACNYRTIFIYSNQPDPNLYFPEAPARLLDSAYLPGRRSQCLCFLIRPWLKLFQQRGKRRSSCASGFQKVKGSNKVLPKCKHWQTVNSNIAQCVSQLGATLFFYNCFVTHSLECGLCCLSFPVISEPGCPVIFFCTNGTTRN